MLYIDSMHKLIHWCFIISRCLDGFSRVIILLKSLDNNKGVTTCKYFQNAIEVYQYPPQVYGNKGTENWVIAKHIIAIRGDEIHCFIGGKSAYDTRIEQFSHEYNINKMITFFMNLLY